MFELAWPWFMLIILLPLLVRLLPAAKQTQQSALKVPFYHQLQQLAGSTAQHRIVRGNAHWLLLTIWVCLVSAMMRPQWVGDVISTPLTGRDLLLAVDVSGSMEIPDLTLNGEQTDRLSVVKQMAGQFIKERLGDRVGLVLFGTQAYLQTPLTHDRNTVAQMLRESEIGIAGKATAIGDAIGLSIKRLRQRPEQSRVLVLLTDGENTAGEVDPREAAHLAAESGVRIYTIGLGADAMEIPGLLFGTRTVNPSADLDEKLLKEIADLTGGKYFRAKDTEGLNQIYQLLDELEPSEGSSEYYRPRSELFYWPLGIAFILSLFIAWRRGGEA